MGHPRPRKQPIQYNDEQSCVKMRWANLACHRMVGSAGKTSSRLYAISILMRFCGWVLWMWLISYCFYVPFYFPIFPLYVHDCLALLLQVIRVCCFILVSDLSFNSFLLGVITNMINRMLFCTWGCFLGPTGFGICKPILVLFSLRHVVSSGAKSFAATTWQVTRSRWFSWQHTAAWIRFPSIPKFQNARHIAGNGKQIYGSQFPKHQGWSSVG